MRQWMCASLAFLVASPALGGVAGVPRAQGTIPDYDFDWAVISEPGNPAYAGEFNSVGGITSERLIGRGSVEYRYRMSVKEVTVGQWFEFAQAYAPFLDNPKQASGLIGNAGFVLGVDANGAPIFQASDFPEGAAEVTWRFAARYVNWLHNDKAITKDAFETGVYDTATFGEALDEDGDLLFFTDQLTRSPGSRFWIPSLDEWIKAAHWDPTKGADGGWRLHPGGQDVPLTPGLPGEPGAQTSAGIENLLTRIPVGAYPDVSAPWGLLDTSGGAPEWLEEPVLNQFGLRQRSIKFSQVGLPFNDVLCDPLFEFSANSPVLIKGSGLRIASAIPSPSTVILATMGVFAFTLRSRRS